MTVAALPIINSNQQAAEMAEAASNLLRACVSLELFLGPKPEVTIEGLQEVALSSLATSVHILHKSGLSFGEAIMILANQVIEQTEGEANESGQD